MLHALDLSMIGDISVLLVGASILLFTGLFAGLYIGRHRYLRPLLELETEFRKAQNKVLRDKMLSTTDTISDSGSPPTSDEPAPPTFSEAAYEALIQELRIEVEELKIEKVLRHEEHEQDLALHSAEIRDLSLQLERMRGDAVEISNIDVTPRPVARTPDDAQPGSEKKLKRVQTNLVYAAARMSSEPDLEERVEESAGDAEYAETAIAQDETPMKQDGKKSDDSILGAFSDLTQKLFEYFDPTDSDEQEEQDAPEDQTEVESSPSVMEDAASEAPGRIEHTEASDFGSSSGSTLRSDVTAFDTKSQGDGEDRGDPVLHFRNLEEHISEAKSSAAQSDLPSTRLGLSQKQRAGLDRCRITSMEQLSILGPRDIIELSAAADVPIRTIVDEWIPFARSNVSEETS